jgi:phosphohistidine phosphatase
MSCTLLLVRHGIAEDATGGMADADRRLTTDGTRKMEGVAIGLRALGVSPEAILSSPLRRAEETALVLQRAILPKKTVETFAPLAPGHDPAEVARALAGHRGDRQLMLVGHQPDLGRLVSHLLSGAEAVQVDFKKGGVAAVEVPSLPPHGPGVLLWMLTPKQLRAIGRSAR